MQSTIIKNNHERVIELSLGAINYDGNETNYIPSVQNTCSLEQALKSHNYSPIHWHKNYRSSGNFWFATGFCVDNDHDTTIEEAKAKLKTENLNYALVTTRSHNINADRFRVFIPFKRRILCLEEYLAVADAIITRLFPASDPKVKDGGRQLFASPASAYYEAVWNREDYDVDAVLKKAKLADGSGSWTDDLIIVDKDGKSRRAIEIMEHTAICCPFHPDTNPSAFIDYSKKSNNHFIHCSSCNGTYWRRKAQRTMEERCLPYYSYGTDVFEIGIIGEKFFIEKIGQHKFYTLVDAFTEQNKADHFRYLVKEKHVRHLKRIDHLGDMEAEDTTFKYFPDDGVFEVHYAPIKSDVQDNEMIDNYLKAVFGSHKEFIKKWLAGYCYSNYRKLPTLVLLGDRGTGKNTFAELLMQIFPTLSQFWHGEERNFTPEVEMKLLVADESVSNNEKQYRTLKKRSGQNELEANHKNMAQYQVKNNMNIIIMSNSAVPIFVEREELPTSEKNNQFFVYKFPKITGELNTNLPNVLKQRIGHYIRTELKRVFDSMQDTVSYRYMIATPITEDETALFTLNTTKVEAEADKIIRRMVFHASNEVVPEYKPFFEKGYLPSKFLDEVLFGKAVSKFDAVKNLKQRGYLVPQDKWERPSVNDKREYCFVMTEKMIEIYTKMFLEAEKQ